MGSKGSVKGTQVPLKRSLGVFRRVWGLRLRV